MDKDETKSKHGISLKEFLGIYFVLILLIVITAWNITSGIIFALIIGALIAALKDKIVLMFVMLGCLTIFCFLLLCIYLAIA